MNLYRFWFGDKLLYGCYANSDDEAGKMLTAVNGPYGFDLRNVRTECITPEDVLIASMVNTEK